MLVVLSDVHLTDEWTAVNVHPAAFARLGDATVAAAAAHRRGAEEIEFALLGDVVDLVRTDYWMREPVPPSERPWSCPAGAALDTATGMHPNAAAIEAQFRDVLYDILARPAARALLAMVASVRERTGLPVRVTYVPGNHDRVLWNFAALRSQLAAAFDVPLSVATVLDRPAYGVRGRHGHEHDDHCHGWEFLTRVLQPESRVDRFDEAAYRVMAIGEVVTAELVAGLVHGARQRLDLDRPEDWAFLNALADLNNVRPFTAALHWLGWFGQRRQHRYLDIALGAFRGALDGFLAAELVRRWDALHPLELVDALALVRVFLKAPDPLETVRRLLDVVHRASPLLRGDRHREAAERELVACPRGIEYLLYGHTHVARTEVFHGSHNGAVRMYINTGTWLPLIERAADGTSYYRAHRLTYAFFFNEREDRQARAGDGPTFDLWSGMRRRPDSGDTLRRA